MSSSYISAAAGTDPPPVPPVMFSSRARHASMDVPPPPLHAFRPLAAATDPSHYQHVATASQLQSAPSAAAASAGAGPGSAYAATFAASPVAGDGGSGGASGAPELWGSARPHTHNNAIFLNNSYTGYHPPASSNSSYDGLGGVGYTGSGAHNADPASSVTRSNLSYFAQEAARLAQPREDKGGLSQRALSQALVPHAERLHAGWQRRHWLDHDITGTAAVNDRYLLPSAADLERAMRDSDPQSAAAIATAEDAAARARLGAGAAAVVRGRGRGKAAGWPVGKPKYVHYDNDNGHAHNSYDRYDSSHNSSYGEDGTRDYNTPGTRDAACTLAGTRGWDRSTGLNSSSSGASSSNSISTRRRPGSAPVSRSLQRGGLALEPETGSGYGYEFSAAQQLGVAVPTLTTLLKNHGINFNVNTLKSPSHYGIKDNGETDYKYSKSSDTAH